MEGAYKVKVMFKNSEDVFLEDPETLYLYAKDIELDSKANESILNFVLGTVFDYMTVTFNDTLFDGRIKVYSIEEIDNESKKYLDFYIVPLFANKITINTKSVTFTEKTQIFIEDMESTKIDLGLKPSSEGSLFETSFYVYKNKTVEIKVEEGKFDKIFANVNGVQKELTQIESSQGKTSEEENSDPSGKPATQKIS